MKVTRYATNALFAMSSFVSAFSPTVLQIRKGSTGSTTTTGSTTGHISSIMSQYHNHNNPHHHFVHKNPINGFLHSTTTTMMTSSYYSTTRLNANVLKLSDPESQLLHNVDVFIFDCDGVIWRVRTTTNA